MWLFSLSQKSKLIMHKDLFNIPSQAHSQVCNLRWWMVDIQVWLLSRYQGQAMSEVGPEEVEVGFLTEVSRNLIMDLLQQWFKWHPELLTCNGIRRQGTLKLKIPSNSKWLILKQERKHKQLVVMLTSKLSSASFSIKVDKLNICWFLTFRKELPIQRSLLICSWWDWAETTSSSSIANSDVPSSTPYDANSSYANGYPSWLHGLRSLWSISHASWHDSAIVDGCWDGPSWNLGKFSISLDDDAWWWWPRRLVRFYGNSSRLWDDDAKCTPTNDGNGTSRNAIGPPVNSKPYEHDNSRNDAASSQSIRYAFPLLVPTASARC